MIRSGVIQEGQLRFPSTKSAEPSKMEMCFRRGIIDVVSRAHGLGYREQIDSGGHDVRFPGRLSDGFVAPRRNGIIAGGGQASTRPPGWTHRTRSTA